MQNIISVLWIKEAWNNFLVNIALLGSKEKRCKSHQHPISTNNYMLYLFVIHFIEKILMEHKFEL